MKDLGRHRHQTGFSLVELMVAIIIGMFSVLVIMQVLGNTATSRRIAVGGGDAQLNGLAGMRALELDIEHAGLGIQSFNISGCSLAYTTSNDAAAVTLSAMAPVQINATSLVPAGDANTDTLLVMAGNSGSPSEGDALTATSTSTTYVVTTPASFAVGDKLLAAPATRVTGCALQVATVTGISGYTLTVTNGTASLASGAIVYNLGGTPTVRAYAIRNANLVVCDYLAYNCNNSSYTSSLTTSSVYWVPVASNIASLRIQYGRDTSGISGSTSTMDGVVDSYDQLSPASDGTAIPVYCKWARIIGVRLAVVARSQQYDKTLAYSGGPTATTSQTTTTLQVPVWAGSTSSTAVPITLTATNWDRYRYVTAQTTVPLRNMIWQGSQPTYQGGSGGC